MSRGARVYSSSGYYHIVSRGIGKQILFEDGEDYERFLETLRRYKDEENFEILAYCMMENHIHLLLHADSGLDRIMKRIAVSYAYYFNTKYERTGHLFQDRYKSEPVDDDRYLLAVVRYIHNNPPKAGICSREKYPWSSWHEYMGKTDLISKEPVLGLVGGAEEFASFSASNEAVECLEISEKKHLSDSEAKAIIHNVLHLESGTQLQTMGRKDRDSALGQLKENGLSIRQIERLTGINRGVILKA